MSFPEVFGLILVAVLLIVLVKMAFSKDKPQAIRAKYTDEEIKRDLQSYEAPEPEYEAVGKMGDEGAHAGIEMDWQSARDWYINEANKHRKKLNSKVGWCKFVLGLQVLVIVGVLVFLLSSGSSEVNDYFVTNFILLAYLGLLGFSWVSYFNGLSKNIEKELQKEAYISIGEDQLSGLWQICKNLRTRMDLGYLDLKIYYVRTNYFEAHVALENNTIYLMVSRAVVSYVEKSPKEVNAIIAHEFGHVLQGDTKMLLVNKNLLTLPAIATGIGFALSGIAVLITLVSGGSLGNPGNVGLSVWLFGTYMGVLQKRRESENLADIASVIYLEDFAIRTVVDKYVPEKGTSSYPSKKERLTFIDTSLNKFSVKSVSNQIARVDVALEA